MSEQIKKSDISEKDIFEYIIVGAEKAQKEIDAMNLALKETAQISKNTLKNKPTDASGLKATEQAIKNSNIAYEKKVKLEQQSVLTKKQMQSAEQALQKQREKGIAQMKKESDAYFQMVKNTRELKNESKRLGAEMLNLEKQGRVNTREYRDLARQYRNVTGEATVLDGKLKKLDSNVGDNFRNVGNYTSAINGLRSGLAQLGLSIGVFQAVKVGISTISEFETSIADLSAITGATGKDLEFLESKAIEFSKAYGTSARDVSEAFKLAGSARPELLKNGDALAKITQQAIILSKASGDDLPTSIANLTGTLNAFDLPSEKAGMLIDVLANASQKGAVEIPYLTEAFQKFGAVAKNAGVSVQDSASAVEILGEKMPRAEMAGTNLRNILIILQEEASSQGREFKGLAGELELLKPRLNDVTFLSKTFGKENFLATQVLISQVDRLKEFSSELNATGTAQDQANTKSKTLGEAFARLKANGEALFLEFRGGASSVSSAIDFLATNLSTIVSVLGKAIISFGIFKAVMAGLKLKDSIVNFIELKKAVKGSADELKSSENGAKGFGKALTAIGFTVAIDLLWEMGKAIFNFVSGTMQADYWTRKFNEGLNGGSKSADIFLSKLDAVNQKRKDELNILLAKGKITQKEYDKEIALLSTNSKKQIDIKLKEARELYRVEKERITKLRAEYAKNKYTMAGATTLGEIGASKEKLGILQGYVLDLEEAEKGYTRELIANNLAQVQNATATNASAKATKATTKELKELKKAYADVTDEIIKRFSIEEQAEQAGKEFAITDTQKQLEDQVKLTELYGTINNERVDELLKEEEALRRKQIEEMNITQEERNFRLIELEDEMAQKRVDIYKDLEQKQEDYAVKIQKKEGETLKDRFAEVKKYVDLTADYFIKRSEEKIAQLDKEIEAGQKQYDLFTELAKNGNIQAQQSLAEQQNIINEANRKKMAEQKRIERLKLAETAFNVYGAKVEAGDKNPLISTIKDVTLLSQFISALPAFEDGTENTGSNGQGVDGKGGFHAILHPHERVLTKEQNSVVGDLTNAELSNLALKYNTGQLIDLKRQDVAGNSYDLIPMIKELKELQSIIKNKPENNIELGKITQTTMQIVESSKRGNITNRNIYSIKRK